MLSRHDPVQTDPSIRFGEVTTLNPAAAGI